MNVHSGETLSRRQLIERSAIAAGVAAAVAALPKQLQASSPVVLRKGDVVLFQGDSITDAGRDRNNQDKANHARALGTGYPMLIGPELLRDHASLDLQIFNRGISGHKVPDLAQRWQQDTIDLKPALLSILIGVNDIWHKFAGRYDGTVADYETGLAALLAKTRDALPNVKIVVCEPFVLRCGAINDTWFPEFDQRRAVAKKVAADAGTMWVPFQTMFDEAVASGTAPNYWAGDGVHPTLAGHSLMAQTWRKVVGL
ncbi:MAG: SGNH/GDSL hydrolase family protein [Planctomycetaceae bacterium]|nr:SGNH/GDSL hydrolase family protein [Planctomycetales bacterium]MCB9927209.1 SGNH/GDSL hydrolase family protein [Planctomycetaceae bacterium]